MAAARGDAYRRPSGVLRVVEFVIEVRARQEGRAHFEDCDGRLYVAFFAGSAERLDFLPAILDTWLFFPPDLSSHIDPVNSEFKLEDALTKPEQAKA
jgi:hypothetical protein